MKSTKHFGAIPYSWEDIKNNRIVIGIAVGAIAIAVLLVVTLASFL